MRINTVAYCKCEQCGTKFEKRPGYYDKVRNRDEAENWRMRTEDYFKLCKPCWLEQARSKYVQ